MKHLLIFLLLTFGSFLFAQPALEQIYFSTGCNFTNDEVSGLLMLRKPDPEAQQYVDRILELANTSQNFELRISDQISNARATATGQRKFILYNEAFLENFQTRSLTFWAAYSLLAHEIGHHVLNHDFYTEQPGTRKAQEIAADEFAARILEQLGATVDEALAGIRTFERHTVSASHPTPAEREAAIRAAYLAQARLRWQSTAETPVVASPSPGPGPAMAGREGKTRITLDASAYRRNRWNRITTAEAEIDQEKISIRYRLEGNYPGRKITVCLLSNDRLIGPEVRTIGSLSGTGVNLAAQREGLIVWNYKLDRYTANEVSKEGMLRVLVYDSGDLPRQPPFGAWFGSIGTATVGVGSMVYGLLERGRAADIYEVYKDVRDPLASVYDTESRQERYDRADGIHVQSQYFFWGGVAAALGGGLWLYDTIRKNDTYRRDGQCVRPGSISWVPRLRVSDRDIQVGLAWQF